MTKTGRLDIQEAYEIYRRTGLTSRELIDLVSSLAHRLDETRSGMNEADARLVAQAKKVVERFYGAQHR